MAVLTVVAVTTTALFIYMIAEIHKMKANIEHSIKLLKSMQVQ